MPDVRKWEYDGVAYDTYGFDRIQWSRNWRSFTDLAEDLEIAVFQIFPLDTQIINLAPLSEQWIVENWTLTNSFRAAYISWDNTKTVGISQQRDRLEREFDYDEFSLQQFYNLYLESTQNFQTATIEHETTIGIELDKNPFSLTSQVVSSPLDSILVLPSPYVAADFVSQKNYLGLSIEHEAILSDRLSLYFEGTLDVAISDTTDIGETSLVEPIESTNFYPEVSLDYQLTDSLLAYASFEYASEPVVGINASDRPLRSEVYRGLEVGVETQLNDNWLATVSYYHETQNNITTEDPNAPDFDLQINEQTSNSWTGEISGSIAPGWWLYGFYTYTDATVTEDRDIQVGNPIVGVARHSSGFWTSYEITQRELQGLGFGGGLSVNGDRPGDTENSFTFPSYLQTDLAVFYTSDRLKAAIGVQNVFDAGIEDAAVTPQTILGTVSWEF